MQSDTLRRPIFGATATLGVSDRIAFLRRTYALLGGALVALAAFTGGMMYFAPETSFAMSRWAFSGSLNWLIVLALFMGVGYLSERLARSETSRGLQFLGLGIGVIAQGLLLQPLLWIAILRFGATGGATLIAQATVVTMAI